MKNSLACPKCRSRRVWQIEKLRFEDKVDQTVWYRTLRLALGKRVPNVAPRRGWQKLWHGKYQTYDTGVIDAWVCAKCGYTELWSREFEKLAHNPDEGIRLHDTTPQQGQYR